MQILFVEDDTSVAKSLSFILRDNGYDVDVVGDGQSAVDAGLTGAYDIIILDIMLPEKDGIEVTKELRQAHINTPILLLTARDELDDKIKGYDSGADDYMTKPFESTELLAHLRALTRRQGDSYLDEVTCGDLTLNLESYDLSCNGKSIHLSYKEFSIARILMTSPNSVFSKEMLLNKAWGMESSAGDNNVEAYISFLRKKLTHLGSGAKIQTLRKAGYRFIGSDQAESSTEHTTIPLK